MAHVHQRISNIDKRRSLEQGDNGASPSTSGTSRRLPSSKEKDYCHSSSSSSSSSSGHQKHPKDPRGTELKGSTLPQHSTDSEDMRSHNGAARNGEQSSSLSTSTSLHSSSLGSTVWRATTPHPSDGGNHKQQSSNHEDYEEEEHPRKMMRYSHPSSNVEKGSVEMIDTATQNITEAVEDLDESPYLSLNYQPTSPTYKFSSEAENIAEEEEKV